MRKLNLKRLRIFSGSSHPQLAKEICKILGVPLSLTETYHYRTGCFEIGLNDNVRGCHVFLIQTSLPDENLLHRHLWELFLMINAAKKASAAEITVVMPYISYARSDKKWRGRMPIAGKLLSSFLEKAGMDRMVTIDLHSAQIEGFFDTETIVDHLRALPLIANHLMHKGLNQKNALLLPGDEGFHKRAEDLGNRLGIPVGSVEKIRLADERVKIQAIKGKLRGKRIIIVDDEICTAGTVREIVEKSSKLGAKSIIVAATHGLFQGKAIENLTHPLIKEILVTDTIPIGEEIQNKLPLTIISVAPLLGSAIREIYTQGSVSSLFK